MKTIKSLLLTALCLAAASFTNGCSGNAGQFEVENGRIVKGDKPYYYIGTNLWYASELAVSDPGRLVKELDTLKALGLDNLRILATDENFEGMDIVLDELGKRDMSAVLYLNNAWEWSEDGYRSYLEKAGNGKQPHPAIDGYEAYTEAMSKFASDKKAVELFRRHVERVVTRYKDRAEIFSWQICNEPRPFTRGEASDKAYIDYIQGTARLIKSLDPDHLVSTGNEGSMGCEGDINFFEKVHDCPDIDYLTIHIWPYNWGWIDPTDVEGGVSQAIDKTNGYIKEHLDVARRLGKPAVIEEFGYPRDGFAYADTTLTSGRDEYYRFVFSQVLSSAKENGPLAGCNFWSWSGYARQTPGHQFWQKGDDLCGDPFQEAQGLNSVYLRDTTTIEVIKEFTGNLSFKASE
ncbi:MAG: cellulase family glycosylhydrolase [Bacteroidales bacterium]